ncbi:MAG: hypothetical protein RQ839_07565 [Thermoproteus sp.]|jgi:hypothetical protein|nr:hypothetical protein [Thermoproteus sp.]MDT7882533.1 hypothetical protein [Thermoproteus sp.]
MTRIPFSQYFKRGEMEDVSEYLRSHATHGNVLVIKVDKPNERRECKCFCIIDSIPVIYTFECADIIHTHLESYRRFLHEIQINVENIVKHSRGSFFIIEVDIPQLHFVKHTEQLKVTYVRTLHQTQDSDPRSSNILGALRWGLEKYVILKIATLDPSGFGDFMEAWLTSRGIEVQGGGRQMGVERFATYYPPNIVFGASDVGKAQRSREGVIDTVRGAVSVTRVEGHNRLIRLEFSLDPPPITYRILGELGVAPRDVKKALASLLAVAAAMLSPSETFGGQAPVPLTTNLEDSSCQQVCVETPHEVDLNIVDRIIESFWCKVKNI